MVRGSGGNVRGNHGSGSRREAVSQTRTSERSNHGSSTRNSATARASDRANHGSSTRNSATARTSERSNHGSSTRNSATARASDRANHGSSTRNSATARASERANHGSSTRNSTTTRTSERANHGSNARNSATARANGSGRANHGSSTRNSATARASDRANHGSSTRNSATARASESANHGSSTRYSTTTRTSERANHGSNARNSATARANGSGRANNGSSTRNSATTSASERANHGSSTRNSTTTRTSERANNGSSRRNDTSATTSASQRSSHRSDSHRGGVSQTRESQRVNHGSSTRDNTSATTRESQRANHGSSTRNNASTRMRESTRRHSQRVHHGSGTHRVRSSDGVYREDYQDEPRGWLLCRACGCFFQCLGAVLLAILCCGSSQRVAADDTAAAATANNNQRNRNSGGEMPLRSPCWRSIPVGFLASSLLFVVLVLISGNSVSTSFVPLGSMNNVETLFAGQTLRIVPPFSFLTQKFRVSVAQYPPASRGISADVFWSTSKCPSLTGPKVKLQHDSENDVPPNNYIWDHYNLNPGSRINGKIHQLSGTTFFYLMKGSHTLEEVETGKVDPTYLDNNAEIKFRVSAGNTRKYQYDTPYWWATDYGDNVYTLVYDNPSQYSDSSFDVNTDITMTTHDMRKLGDPYCGYLRHFGDHCPFSPSRSDCIIIKAFFDDDKDNHEVVETAEAPLVTDSDSDRSISIEVEFYRDWKDISLYSVIPLFLSLLVYVFSSLWRWLSGRNEIDDEEGDLTEPLLSPEDDEGDTTEPFFPPDDGEVEDGDWDRPPPSAPQSVPEATPQPSAPIKDDDVIVVPPESVEVV